MTELPTIAVIADAHFHDIYSDYGCTGITIDGKQLTLRSWQDTRKSPRVFNESGNALRQTLKQKLVIAMERVFAQSYGKLIVVSSVQALRLCRGNCCHELARLPALKVRF